jgi:microcystin-dependent protein
MAESPLLGTIFIFAGNFAPSGYQLCQGQLLPISQYAALFSILGTTYGGNGTTNFALPDLRGRAPIGEGSGPGLSAVALGQVGGAQNVAITTGNMPQHNHTVNVSTSPGSQPGPANNFIAAGIDSQGGNVLGFNTAATSGKTLAPTFVGLAGQNTPLSVQNPYLGINYIIAMVGIFPSRN